MSAASQVWTLESLNSLSEVAFRDPLAKTWEDSSDASNVFVEGFGRYFVRVIFVRKAENGAESVIHLKQYYQSKGLPSLVWDDLRATVRALGFKGYQLDHDTMRTNF